MSDHTRTHTSKTNDNNNKLSCVNNRDKIDNKNHDNNHDKHCVNNRDKSSISKEEIQDNRVNQSNVKNNEVVNFGCRLNLYESEIIKDHIKNSGLNNVIVFNSCAVTKEAEKQLQQSIRKHKSTSPEKRIIVTGCAAQISPEKYHNMPEVDSVIGNLSKTQLTTYTTLTNQSNCIIIDDVQNLAELSPHLIENFDNHSRSFIQIQNGCNHRCTFCIIPYGRGSSRSVPVSQIIHQIQLLLNKGYEEIVLTGVDLTDYGSNLPGNPRLGNMIKRIFKYVPNLKRLRLSSIDVAEIDADLMDIILHEERFLPHIHISLQSGDNMILKRMKRRHNREQVIDFTHKVMTKRSNFAFGADIICGFPTETDVMFENSLKLVSEANLIHLHVFPFSVREGTPAAKIPINKQVSKEIIKQRCTRLRAEGEKQKAKFLQNFIGKTITTLVENTKYGKTDEFIVVDLSNFPEQYLISQQKKVINCLVKNIRDNKIIATEQ